MAAAGMFAAVQSADAEIVITSPDGGVSAEFPLTVDSRIFFGDSGVAVSNGSANETVTWDKVGRISFSNVGEVGKLIREASGWTIAESPVGETLTVQGYDAAPALLRVFSLSGGCVLTAENWQGESLSVSHLPSGIYILNISDSTQKFIKK